MSLLTEMQDYLRRYSTATQPELAQQLQTTPEVIEMMGETLRAKGKVRFLKTMPACMSGACSGNCGTNQAPVGAKREAVRVYEWLGGKPQ